ncbi:MAG: hypothetical protein WAU52_04960 [Burkholderiales bacterium]
MKRVILAAMLLSGMSATWAAGWYLVVPPRSDYDEHAPFLRGYKILEDRPLSEWQLSGIFDSVFDCDARRGKLELAEHKLYYEGFGEYQKAQREQSQPELLRYERFASETHHANYSAYATSRCVPTSDPRLHLSR